MKESQQIQLDSRVTTTERYHRRTGDANDVPAAAFDRFDEMKNAGKGIPLPADEKQID